MKNLILVLGLSLSNLCFGADWVYVTSGGNQNFFIDQNYYKYDVTQKTVDVWSKVTQKKLMEDDYYTKSKTLIRYLCPSKSSKNLATVTYDESGNVFKSSTKPAPGFSLIFPETVDEKIWEVACSTKGKGLKLYEPEKVNLEKIGIKSPN
ncbi:surface-adhesin E family protein [Acinetobacter baumannii]